MSFMKTGPMTMLKDGATMVDEPVLKNITAAREMSKITKSSMGPNGLCKLIINHLSKTLVTHDSAAIVNELEVEHPAAKLLVMAAKAMQEEVGDGTNLVISLAGEFLSQAESLLRMGLHATDVIEGYHKAGQQALEYLNELSCSKVTDCLKVSEVLPAIRTAIASKQFGLESFLGELVAQACVAACPTQVSGFNVDSVRVCKLDGDSVLSSRLIRGFVLPRTAEGTIKHVKAARVAVYGCAVDIPSTETKGSALIHSADELLSYSRNEEKMMDEIIKNIAAAGATVVVSNSTIGDLALHYLNRYQIMAVKVPSKFELKRLCAAIGARTLAKIDVPTAEDLGRCDHVDVEEIGGKNIIVFAQQESDSRLSTIVVRGATQNVRDDVERALDDGINVFKALTRDGRLVPGGGAVEMELQRRLTNFAERTPGLDQYAIRKYAASFEVVARTLADVSGFNGNDLVTRLEAEHNAGNQNYGVNVNDGTALDAVAAGIVDPLLTKVWAIRLATEVAITILTVDQIIVSKQAGGPKLRPDQARDED